MATPPPTAAREVRVLLVDDDPLVRRALRDALAHDVDLSVMDDVGSGTEAVELVGSRHPEVVLMDVDMPDLDGITATLRLHRRDPDVGVILLSTVVDAELGVLAMRAGAAGFLGKDTSVDALIRAVRGVARGEAAISRLLTRDVVDRLRSGAAAVRPVGMRPIQSPLTTREWEVLDLLSDGASTEEMADRLVLSIETVRSHVKHVLAKLGAHSRAEAVARATAWRTAEPADGEDIDELAFRRAAERLLARRHLA